MVTAEATCFPGCLAVVQLLCIETVDRAARASGELIKIEDVDDFAIDEGNMSFLR